MLIADDDTCANNGRVILQATTLYDLSRVSGVFVELAFRIANELCQGHKLGVAVVSLLDQNKV